MAKTIETIIFAACLEAGIPGKLIEKIWSRSSMDRIGVS